MSVGGISPGAPTRIDALDFGRVDSADDTSVSLLPEPDGNAPILDHVALLYVLQAKDEQLGLKRGELTVKTASRDREVHLKEKAAAEQKAVEAAREAAQSHGLWGSIGDVLGTVAKVAGVVASVALAVVSCGAATPIAALAIAGAVLSTASFVEGEAHILEKLGVDPKTAGWINVAMSVGGAACSGGASLGTATTTTAMTVTTVVAKTAEAGAHVVRAVDAAEQSRYRAREEDSFGDALAAERAAGRIKDRLFAFLDDLRAQGASDRRAMKTTLGVMETLDATALAAVR